MRSDATAHADRTALRAVRRLPRTSHLAQPSRGQRRCSGQPYRMQLTLGARRTAGRRQAADLAPGLPAEQVQPPPTKPHRNGPSALQATVPSGRLQARRIGVIRVIEDHQALPGRITPDIRVITAHFFGLICGDDRPYIARFSAAFDPNRTPEITIAAADRTYRPANKYCGRPTPAIRQIRALAGLLCCATDRMQNTASAWCEPTGSVTRAPCISTITCSPRTSPGVQP